MRCLRLFARISAIPPRKLRGFTLIELLVVFTLIALLLTIAVPRYLNVAERSRDKAREQNMATLRDAIDKFKADKGLYPASLNELVNAQYLRSIPVDPVTDSKEWTLIPDPSGNATGVFDIAPPGSSSLDSPTTTTDTPPLPPGVPTP